MSREAHERQQEASGTEPAEQQSAPPDRADRGGHAHRDATSVEDRLVRVLDTPHLARVVPHLPAETLHQIVRYRGVEECGELLVSATPAQLNSVLDLDLWRSAEAGVDEQFDLARFGEWIEGLVEGGDAQAATIVSRMDSRLVVAGLSGHVRVFDPATLPSEWSAEDDAPGTGAVPSPGLSCEIGGYVVHARFADSWDAIVALLLSLEANHRRVFHKVMRGCRRLSDSRPEVDGLDDLLTNPAQALHDVGLSRHHRRSVQGFLAPPEARAFLAMARRSYRGPIPPPKINPIAAAYFRAADEEVAQSEPPQPPSEAVEESPPDDEVRETVEAVAVLLAEAALAQERPRALLGAPAAQDAERTRVEALMEAARLSDEPTFLARGREVAFLANALMAGCSVQARPFTPKEASDAALATCNLGLDFWPSRWPEEDAPEWLRTGSPAEALPDSFLADHDLLTAFHVGWAALHETSLFVAQELVEVLKNVRTLDTKTHEGLVILRRVLVKCCRAGTPWGVRDALDVLAILDTVAWTGLLGALDECPVVPDALTAVVERRKGTVSATAFEFVSSADQIARVRAFGRRLADVFLTP
jgi:hypothetical protein